MEQAADLLRELREVVERLSAVDTTSLSPEELRELTVGLQREQARVAVVAADLLVLWEASGIWREGGTLRPQLALGRDAKRDRERVRFDLRRARLLAQLPHTREAVMAGRLSMDHVDLFVTYATAARLEWFLAHEGELVALCEQQELFDDARRVVQYWAARCDDELGLRRQRPEGSRVYLSRSTRSGAAELGGTLHSVHAEIVDRELRRLMREVELDDRATGVMRTLAERRAEALVRMASRSVNATGMTARPLFEVIVGDETARRLCELASGHVIDPGGLVPHVDTAVMETFLFDGLDPILAVSKQRTFRGALRRAIKVRDRRCRHPSVCPTSATYADVDHRTPAVRGGPTSQFNGRCLCTPHNRDDDLRDESAGLPERVITRIEVEVAKMRWANPHLRIRVIPWPMAS